MRFILFFKPIFLLFSFLILFSACKENEDEKYSESSYWCRQELYPKMIKIIQDSGENAGDTLYNLFKYDSKKRIDTLAIILAKKSNPSVEKRDTLFHTFVYENDLVVRENFAKVVNGLSVPQSYFENEYYKDAPFTNLLKSRAEKILPEETEGQVEHFQYYESPLALQLYIRTVASEKLYESLSFKFDSKNPNPKYPIFVLDTLLIPSTTVKNKMDTVVNKGTSVTYTCLANSIYQHKELIGYRKDNHVGSITGDNYFLFFTSFFGNMPKKAIHMIRTNIAGEEGPIEFIESFENYKSNWSNYPISFDIHRQIVPYPAQKYQSLSFTYIKL